MTAHSSWAEAYDRIYEQSFGTAYQELTQVTLEAIGSRVDPPARIVDFGAGTGRLSLPLARLGYRVTAVEPCKEMLEQLLKKQSGCMVTGVQARMADFWKPAEFDLALCVFSVLLYLLDEESLESSIEAAARSLRPGGLLFIDVPSQRLFQSYTWSSEELERSVAISDQGSGMYHYEESSTLHDAENSRTYFDAFHIRYWSVDAVFRVLHRHGFAVVGDYSDRFAGSGAAYFLLAKGAPAHG
jgi:SAM-dependent methyltransferase